MTNTTDRVALMADVERISAELRRAQRNLATLERLKSAEADAKRLSAELEAAQAALVEANVAAVEDHRTAAFAAFKDIVVTTVRDDRKPDILGTTFSIVVTKDEYDGRDMVSQTRTYSGFNALPSDAFSYLLEMHPDRIPADILALDPSDPYDAFGRYFGAKRRGYLTSPAAEAA